jgi:diguanylate cyclase (GGDEF)-like protein
MTALRGPLARLERSREELAKAWLLRVIQRASLEEIRDLPTEVVARELPELIGDIVRSVADDGVELGEDQASRAAVLASLRPATADSAADLAQDVAALHAVLVHALREELGDAEDLGEAVERLAEATGVVQGVAMNELVRSRSRELESQANTDPLTGLYNLRYMQRQLGHLLELHKRYEHPFAVLVMDVDGLKRINDAHGHQAGDRILMQIAIAVQRSIRSVDTSARVGGDEFCVLAPQQDAAKATTLAERLSAAVRDEVAMPDVPPVSLSIGVVSCPEHGAEGEALIDAADRAMYRAKSAGQAVSVGGSGGAEVAEGLGGRAPTR